MPPPRSLGWRVRWLAFATLVAVVATALPDAPAGADSSTWAPPVPGAVVRPYVEPLARFASGHRGVDFAAPAGTEVRAANDGRVTFAGTVSGSLHVVVEHAGGIRTSYSFLARIEVDEGAAVRRGETLGIAGGSGGGHRPGALHFGTRIGDRYFDPMLLFGPTDLTELVRLVPSGVRVPSDETFIWRELQDDGDDCAGGIPLVEQLCDAGEAVVGVVGERARELWEQVEDLVDLGLAALRTVVEATRELVERVERVARDVLQTLRDVANKVERAVEELATKIANGAIAVFNAVVEAGLKLYEQLTSCPQPPPRAHSKGSGNVAVAVGGLGSWRRRQQPDAHGDAYDEKFQTRWRMLGYDRDEVEYFSYRPGSRTYGPKDTLSDLHAQARSLGRQIQEQARAHPGTAIDLVGHSQGGLVIDLFLTDVYGGHEDEYPPIDNVVTFGSPHEGTPIADLGQQISDHMFAGPIVRLLDPTDIIGAESVEQMTSDSETIKKLWDAGEAPEDIRFISIIGSEDPIVPSNRADVPGATKVVVPAGAPLWPDDHSAVLRDDDAISAAQAHLSGRAPADSCGLFTDVGGWLYTELVDKVNERISLTPGGTAHPYNPEYWRS